ncbi:putative bifunctional diguanylate cyclase/phosphodiesterase [Kutzneria albida]|uniref:Uncharacterized protein n=1 Tax=Kutzneria albida DSM 43870 TaxID=1449976 RepID=W5WKU1_9PSEU|nr:EAL domain-containing protein [Kutzneria albida]AHI01824.1 hypothetical protein KALB_8467 [Kutzneria albida DSM 43870]
MSSPLPHDPLSAHAPSGAAEPSREHVKLVRKWSYLIGTTTFIPLSHNEIEQQLLSMLGRVVDAVRAEEPEELALAVGAELVDMNCVGETSLRRTLEVLTKGLPTLTELRTVERLAERVVITLGALSSGYVEALRQSIFQQQENLNRALFKAARDTQSSLVASEARFNEIVSCTTSGVAIMDLDGRFTRTNRALREILDRSQNQLAELSVFDLAEDPERLRRVMDDLLAGEIERSRQRRSLLLGEDDHVQPMTTLSLLRGGDGKPAHYALIVEDDSELKLLQSQLKHQSLHDVLTGLPNRQFFTTRLESVLHKVDPATGATLYQLDLDAFSVITDGLGRHVGDQLLCAVAERLKRVFAGENAMIARFDGDEFAVLVQNSPSTPDVVSTVKAINEELAEPLYVDNRGVAASACIGVVRMPTPGVDLAEVLRTANLTLHRAKRNGRRQWELFDLDRDANDRESFSLAAAMPGAWESGEVEVVYRPQVELGEGSPHGVEAVLRWDHPELGLIGHRRCVELAETTGLILPLGNWLLRTACERTDQFDDQLQVTVSLTPSQAGDPDLISEVLGVLDETGIRPSRLRLGIPVGVLTVEGCEAVENLTTLVDTGIEVMVEDFGTGIRDLACLEDVRVGAVRISPWLVQRQASRSITDSLVDRSLRDLVSTVHMAGSRVVVGEIETAEQADWWRAAGCDFASGGYFGPDRELDELAD